MIANIFMFCVVLFRIALKKIDWKIAGKLAANARMHGHEVLSPFPIACPEKALTE